MATKISYGWIRTGQDKLIETNASRTRVNLIGSLNLETMGIVKTTHKTINSESMDEHFADNISTCIKNLPKTKIGSSDF